MKYFELIDTFDVSALAEQVSQCQDLWDAHNNRTGHDIFKGTSDIWVRYRNPKELHFPADFAAPHFAVFYPAWYRLPALKPIVHSLMCREHALHLGGIMITKIPPNGRVKPHHDRGGWHAEFYKRKIYVPILTNSYVVNRCEDEIVVMETGEAWYFNNLVEHEVVNTGDTDRITLIVCMNTEE